MNASWQFLSESLQRARTGNATAFSGSSLGTLADSLVSRACSTSASLDFQKILQKKRCQRPIQYQAADVSKTQNATVFPNRNMLHTRQRMSSALVGNPKFQPMR